MQPSNGKHPHAPDDRYALRVLRVEPGTRVTVRTLSDAYGGLLTHWYPRGTKGRSVYCQGEQCYGPAHREPTFWKGYALVEQLLQRDRKWYPYVLEITESLELDFRGQWARAQKWELTRAAEQKGKSRTPVVGKYLEAVPPDTLRAPFDFGAVLLAMYHVPEIYLDRKNPLPSRLLVAPSLDTPAVKSAEQARAEVLDEKARADALELFRGRWLKSANAAKEASGDDHN